MRVPLLPKDTSGVFNRVLVGWSQIGSFLPPTTGPKRTNCLIYRLHFLFETEANSFQSSRSQPTCLVTVSVVGRVLRLIRARVALRRAGPVTIIHTFINHKSTPRQTEGFADCHQMRSVDFFLSLTWKTGKPCLCVCIFFSPCQYLIDQRRLVHVLIFR